MDLDRRDARPGPRGGDPGPTAVVAELFGAGDPPGWRVVAERDTIVAAERLADA